MTCFSFSPNSSDDSHFDSKSESRDCTRARARAHTHTHPRPEEMWIGVCGGFSPSLPHTIGVGQARIGEGLALICKDQGLGASPFMSSVPAPFLGPNFSFFVFRPKYLRSVVTLNFKTPLQVALTRANGAPWGRFEKSVCSVLFGEKLCVSEMLKWVNEYTVERRHSPRLQQQDTQYEWQQQKQQVRLVKLESAHPVLLISPPAMRAVCCSVL